MRNDTKNRGERRTLLSRRVIIAIGAILLLCADAIVLLDFSSPVVAAKRKAPAPIKPVIIAGIEYRVPNKMETEGIVEAWNITPRKLLWTREIYLTLKFPSFVMETDTQLNFITSLTVGPATNELTIVNEKGKRYILDTNSRIITRP